MFFKQSERADQPGSGAKAETATKKPALPSSMAAPGATATPAAAKPAAKDAGPREAARPSDNGRRLIVGDGIQLKGEISACDRLVVEGYVEATLNQTRTLEIQPTGQFIGGCEVEEAEISGIYDGNLTVRGRLTVRTGGRVSGTICYGEIELERGATVAGELKVREAQAKSAGRPSGKMAIEHAA